MIDLSDSAADVLIALDSEHRVTDAVGDTSGFYGKSPKEVSKLRLEDLVAPEDAGYLRHLLHRVRAERLRQPVFLRIPGPNQRQIRVIAVIRPNSRMPGHALLSLMFGSPSLWWPGGAEARQNSDSQLIDRPGICRLAARCLHRGTEIGQVPILTLVQIDGFADLLSTVADAEKQNILRHLGFALRVGSIDGLAAAQVASEKFCFIHGTSGDLAAARRDVLALLVAETELAATVEIATTSIPLDVNELNGRAAAPAIEQIVAKFVEIGSVGFEKSSLAESGAWLGTGFVDQSAGLRQIVSEKSFTIAFQPIIDLETRAIHHFEALARFDHPEQQLSPMETIILAEDVGVISELDLAICERVIEAVSQGLRDDRAPSVAVNISGRSLGNPLFVDTLRTVLKRHPAERRFLMFEITETSEITDLQAANEVLQELRAGGNPVCLDDFGAGAAAFQYLRALQVDLVKIDGAYVRNALEDRQARAFLKAMTALCGDLEIETVAEMVEDEATAAFLMDSGVRYGQGYLFGRPSDQLPSSKMGQPVTRPQ